TDWLRMTVGLRQEIYNAHDQSFTTAFSGSTSQSLFQPKGNIAIGPFWHTELYLSAGRGFHSEDVRGVFGTVPGEGQPGLLGPTAATRAGHRLRGGPALRYPPQDPVADRSLPRGLRVRAALRRRRGRGHRQRPEPPTGDRGLRTGAAVPLAGAEHRPGLVSG